MKYFATYILFLTFISLTSTGCHKTEIMIPSNFVESTPPKPETKEWFELNYTGDSYRIEIVDFKLKTQLVKPANKCIFKLSDGTLYSYDHGEWGGQLFFASKDSADKKVLIKRGNVKYIFPYQSKLYFIEGLAHMGISEGAIYELYKKNHKFTYKKILEFDDAPEAFTIYNNEFFIATHKKFYRIRDFKKELIFKNEFWAGLYPCSIAVHDEKTVFVGIRGGFVKLDLLTKTLKFYKYQKQKH